MSDAEPDSSQPTASRHAAAKPQRVLACLACQQRKVKCDRKFPCSTCVKSGMQCVPVNAPRQRRRRFPEGELLQRVRHLESLLRQHNINFEPLHAEITTKNVTEVDGVVPNKKKSGSPEIKTEPTFEARNLWHAMNQKVRPHRGLSLMEEVLILDHQPDTMDDNNEDDEDDNDQADLRDVAGRKTWDQMYKNSTDFLLFGSRIADMDLSILHPDHVQIFKLWQIYLENVNPLLKVTHTPTLQVRFIYATGNLQSVDPDLEALMFSVYCVAVMSLAESECQETLGFPKADLMQRFRFGCQQALLKCDFLQSDHRDCLAALFLYLVAVRPDTDPRSLSSLLGLTLRMAQRMGLDNESSNAKCGPLEGEMRRRLWWALILFDNRVCEMGDYRAASLSPAWNCKPPANLNDFDLQPEMKHLPQSHDRPTEMTLALLRYQVADLVRHSSFFLDFTNPSLKTIANATEHGGTLGSLEQKVEDSYLRYCNLENPFQFMTVWVSRGHIARYRLFQHFAGSPDEHTEQQREEAISFALTMLETDTIITTSSQTRKYTWFMFFHFPFPAYIHILQYLKREPLAKHAEKCWQVMSQSSQARFADPGQDDHPFHKTPIFRVFTRIIVKAWEARVAALGPQNKDMEPPYIVSEFLKRMTTPSGTDSSVASSVQTPLRYGTEDILMAFPAMSMDTRFDGFDAHGNMSFGVTGDAGACGATVDVEMSQLDLTGVDWSSLYASGLQE